MFRYWVLCSMLKTARWLTADSLQLIAISSEEAISWENG
jgi:hypothetical protein